MKPSITPKLNICMLIPLLYQPDIEVRPQIGICSYLANFGHKVTWVMSSTASSTRQFFWNNVRVYAVPSVQCSGESSLFAKIFGKMSDALRRIRSIPGIFGEGEYNLIFVRDDVFDGLIAAYLQKKHHVPFVFELSNPLEQERGIYKIESKKPKFLYYVIAWFNSRIRVYIIKKADLILPTTQWFEEGLNKKGISKSKLMPYPNGIEVKSFVGKDGRDIVEKYNLSDSRVIIYIGTLDKARHLSLLIEAFARVSKEKRKARLVMVGDGNDRGNLERLAAELGIRDEVVFTGQVPQSEVPHFIAAADIGVSPVPPLSFYKVSSPIKTLEYMAMAKPVVANEEIFEHREVLAQSGGGISVPFTSEAFAAAIIELLDNPDKAVKMGSRGREWAVKNRSYEVLARRLEEKYLALLQTKL